MEMSSNGNQRGMMMAMNHDRSDEHRHKEQIQLPPGFRFHPTDEELVTHYLSPKIIDAHFNPVAIGEVDLNKIEPWDLPRQAKMGEKEWYFFCVKDRKYPTGLRTNRATEAGYWKATGKDKEIFRGKALVGMKKTLVFYTGRAPKGHKTNWVMHEYRIEGVARSSSSSSTSSSNKYNNTSLLKSSKDDWVICRVFNKGSNLKKMSSGPIQSGRMMLIDTDTDTDSQYDAGSGGPVASDVHDDHHHHHHHRFLPPLMDSSPVSTGGGPPFNASSSSGAIIRQYYNTPPQHVTCFSTTTAVRDEVGMEMNLNSISKQQQSNNGFQVNTVANREFYNAAAAAANAVSCSSSVMPDSSSGYGMNELACGQQQQQEVEEQVYYQQDQASVLRMLLDGGNNNYGGGSDYYAFDAAGSSGTVDRTTTTGGGVGYTSTTSTADISSGGGLNNCSEMMRRNHHNYGQQQLQGGNNINPMNQNRLDSSSSVDLECLLNF